MLRYLINGSFIPYTENRTGSNIMDIQNLEANAALDDAAMEEVKGGGHWKLKRTVYRKKAIRKIYTK